MEQLFQKLNQLEAEKRKDEIKFITETTKLENLEKEFAKQKEISNQYSQKMEQLKQRIETLNEEHKRVRLELEKIAENKNTARNEYSFRERHFQGELKQFGERKDQLQMQMATIQSKVNDICNDDVVYQIDQLKIEFGQIFPNGDPMCLQKSQQQIEPDLITIRKELQALVSIKEKRLCLQCSSKFMV